MKLSKPVKKLAVAIMRRRGLKGDATVEQMADAVNKAIVIRASGNRALRRKVWIGRSAAPVDVDPLVRSYYGFGPRAQRTRRQLAKAT